MTDGRRSEPAEGVGQGSPDAWVRHRHQWRGYDNGGIVCDGCNTFDNGPYVAGLEATIATLTAERDEAREDVQRLLREKLPDGTTLYRMAKAYPDMKNRGLEAERDRLVAQNAALVEAIEPQLKRIEGAPCICGELGEAHDVCEEGLALNRIRTALATNGAEGGALLAELAAYRSHRHKFVMASCNGGEKCPRGFDLTSGNGHFCYRCECGSAIDTTPPKDVEELAALRRVRDALARIETIATQQQHVVERDIAHAALAALPDGDR